MEYHLSAKFYKIDYLLKANHNEYLLHHQVHQYVLIKPTYKLFLAWKYSIKYQQEIKQEISMKIYQDQVPRTKIPVQTSF